MAAQQTPSLQCLPLRVFDRRHEAHAPTACPQAFAGQVTPRDLPDLASAVADRSAERLVRFTASSVTS